MWPRRSHQVISIALPILYQTRCVVADMQRTPGYTSNCSGAICVREYDTRERQNLGVLLRS